MVLILKSFIRLKHYNIKKLKEDKKTIDCSRVIFGSFYLKKYRFFKTINLKSAGGFNDELNCIIINSYHAKKFSEVFSEHYYNVLITRIISHESLHMILIRLFDNKTSEGLDKILKHYHRYDLQRIDNSGI